MRKQELAEVMEVVFKLISKEATNERELSDVISRILQEGVTKTVLVDFIIARNHEREEQDLYGLTTFEDIQGFLRALRTPTPDNLRRWERRFKSGEVQYLCPDCGFSGNSGVLNITDRRRPDFCTTDGANIHCMTCGCFKNERYFTHKWTPDEQAAFEAEQEQKWSAHDARENREKEARERAKRLEPKVADVCQALDGVGEYVNETEDRKEIEPYIRAIIHWTVKSVTEIVEKWKTYVSLPIPTVAIAQAVNRVMIREASMKGILDNLDLLEPQDLSQLRPQEVGEERFFFTWEEIEHECTHRVEKWDEIFKGKEITTSALTDGRFVISILPKGWIEAHPCQCDDCKAARAAE